MNLNALTMQVNREHDACGIFAYIEKSGTATRKPIEAGLAGLIALRHRGGYVDGEGDGCGLLVDIPRLLWQQWLFDAGLDGSLAHSERFFVGHFMLQQDVHLAAKVQELLQAHGLSVKLIRQDAVNKDALGLNAQSENSQFLQICGLVTDSDETFDLSVDATLYQAQVALEAFSGVHVASLSRFTAVYKVVGDGDTLRDYYLELQDPLLTSSFSLVHTRYSTNTATSISRVQPFALLGHNGEINTIARFYSEANMLDIQVDPLFSDSQMVDRVLLALVAHRNWTLFEACELLFPPIIHEIKQMSSELSDMYMFFRSLWGPFAQGPAGLMIRYGNEAVFSVDALGLRPMWLIETAEAYCFSSEQGIISPNDWVNDPKPLCPGEKIGIEWSGEGRSHRVLLHSYTNLQNIVHSRAGNRFQFAGEHRTIHFSRPNYLQEAVVHPVRDSKPFAERAAAFGFRERDYKLLEAQLQSGTEMIQSLGFDSPLAALNPNLRSLSDFLQETVAVVTNPAIDREREIEHFSTRTILGQRPALTGHRSSAPRVEVQAPILLEEMPAHFGIERQELQTVAHRHGTMLYEDALELLHNNPNSTVEILVQRHMDEAIPDALARFQLEALAAVQAGANIIVLDDRLQFKRGSYVDPFLAVTAIHKSLLRPASKQGGEHLRRRVSLVVRSGGLRNLHDIVVAIGLGADAVVPYMMWEFVASKGNIQFIDNLYTALTKGLEKVMSTLGIHEVRGYERLFSSIGLSTGLAAWLGIPSFCGSEFAGYNMTNIEEDAVTRQALYDGDANPTIGRQKMYQLYPRIWKSAGQVGQGVQPYPQFFDKLQTFERDHPISLRHVLGLRTDDLEQSAGAHGQHEGVQSVSSLGNAFGGVDTSIDGHTYPFVISSMSFGSQGEVPYRAYAEAAYQLNIVCLNGEGGEMKDLLGKYPRNRGRQIASGRFGVNAELCNGAYVLEIKIGQGAKPGEGGHLPGSKVTVQVANARNASPGVDLISPSNNHDIYSIEDLAQVIYELKAVNPLAKVAVKVPVVPNIGTIAVGIVKAGADVVTLSGFDGGTGAARAHAIHHVGLPMEIGVKLAHDALCEAGLRDIVEVWADGGMKSGLDVIKAILLGANRVGFGTMAMIAIGCTGCRACHTDKCHVGIATQMTDREEAAAKGVTTFSPREYELSVEHLVRFFGEVGKHVQQLTMQLGAKRTQDLVGRRDLLVQISHFDAVDTSWLTTFRESFLGKGTNVQTRTVGTSSVEDAVVQTEFASSTVLATGTDGVRIGVGLSAVTDRSVIDDGANIHGVNDHGLNGDVTLPIQAVPRALGIEASGEYVRHSGEPKSRVLTHLGVAGAGFAGFHTVGMVSIAKGGAQDGVGKGAFGGKVVVLKHPNMYGKMVGGSVGKGLAYGAQHGLFIIQGNADARAGIRLSGADLIIGGEVQGALADEHGFIGTRSNIKGFAFEYMTNGRALVLGDPGPWICSGMTGGTVYLRLNPSVGLTHEALRRRLAKGAKVSLRYLDGQGDADVTELLLAYQKELRRSGQHDVATSLAPLLQKPADHFLMVKPGTDVVEQDIATE